MRILHLIPELSGGGAERQLSYLAPELASMGHEIHLAYSRGGDDMPELPGVVLHRLSSRSSYDPYVLWQLLRLVRKIKPDIIHTWILQMDILGGIVARVRRVPWILREPSCDLAYSRQWKDLLRAWLGSKAQIIVSNSRGGDEYWKKRAPRSRRYVIRNGLPVQEIARTAAALPSGLSRPDAPIVLYVGRLTASKNLKNLLKALAHVKRQRSVFGVLCGQGPQRDELEALVRELGLDEDIQFTGHLPAAIVWATMKRSSAFVSLSTFEGCSNTIMEAMACGCALVVSDIPAHHEILDAQSALFVDSANTQQAAEAIVAALSNVSAAEDRAVIAKEKAQAWSIAEMACKYETVYKEVNDL